jgi:hypothetical protein
MPYKCLYVYIYKMFIQSLILSIMTFPYKRDIYFFCIIVTTRYRTHGPKNAVNKGHYVLPAMPKGSTCKYSPVPIIITLVSPPNTGFPLGKVSPTRGGILHERDTLMNRAPSGGDTLL